MEKERVAIYIDGNNLHKGAKELGFDIDYKKFCGWLRQKYNASHIYLFIGLIPEKVKMYQFLQEAGLILVFKQTISVEGKIKGNCDAELVLNVVSDFYTNNFDKCILLTGDGDFGCLVQFLKDNNIEQIVISPNKSKCSILLKNKNIQLDFLNDHYHKFSKSI